MLFDWTDCISSLQWIFWVGPLIGAFLAAVYHKLVLRGEVAKALGSFRSTSATV